jgi:type IV pilus assembly protein PilE
MEVNTDMKMKSQHGFTLIELMIVVAIVGIITSFAVPGYSDYVVRAKRQLAEHKLLEIASRQEQHMLDNKTYANDLTKLGYPSTIIGTDSNGDVMPYDSGNADIEYAFAVYTAVTSTSGAIIAWDVYAFPWGSNAGRDTKCGRLQVDETGAQDALYGTAKECW